MRLRLSCLCALLLLGQVVAASAQTLVVNGYGAEYEEIILRTIIRPFEQRFGARVTYDVNGSASQDYARIRATRGAPGYDVVVMTAAESIRGCDERLLERLTPERVPNMRRLLPAVQGSVGECGAVHEVQYMALLYRTDRIATPPESWAALADPRWRGRLLLPKFENILSLYLTQMLSVMQGGTLDNPDRGFAFFAQIAPHALAFEQSSSLIGRYLETGEAWIAPFWNARGELLTESGQPLALALPREGTIPLLATLNIPSGADNKDLAFRFVNFWLEKEQQEAWAQAYRVGTIRDDVELPPAFRARQITTAADLARLHLPDLRNIANQRNRWQQRFQRDVASRAP
jgi:putative spermidine/putrescine transport system substrate-binding protein